MDRTVRSLLVVLTVVLAGCSANTAGPASTPGAEETTPREIANETAVEYLETGSNLGKNERPIGLVVRNADNASRTVTVRLKRGGKPLFERTYELAPGAEITGTLDYEARYAVTVETREETEVVRIDAAWFDCNGKTTTVTVSESGIDSSTLSTMMACPENPIHETLDFLSRLLS